MDQLLFSRIDQILRPLLASIEKYQQAQSLSPSPSPSKIQIQTSNKTNSDNRSQIQNFLILYQEQCDLLQQLRGVWSVIFPPLCVHIPVCVRTRHRHDNAKEVGDDNEASEVPGPVPVMVGLNVLWQMRQYILLPIILILQRSIPDKIKAYGDANVGVAKNGNGNGDDVQMDMWINAHRRCVEEAALSLKLFTDILHQDKYENGHGDDEDEHVHRGSDKSRTTPMQTNSNLHIDTDLRIKCIIALTESLTGVIQNHAFTRTVTRTGSRHHTRSSNLDKAEECILALLSCMEALCKPPKNTNANNSDIDIGEVDSDHEFVSAIQVSMNGRILFQMVQCCISVFEDDDEAVGAGAGTGPDRRIPVRGVKMTSNYGARPADIKGNVILKVQALRTLESLFQLGQFSRSMSEQHYEGTETLTKLWRAMFPGVFKALFGETLMQLRFSTSQSSSKVAAMGLRVLSALLNRALTIVDSDMYIEETNNNNNEFGKGNMCDPKSPQYIDVATKMLLAATLNSDVNIGAAMQTTETKSRSADFNNFLDKVHQMIPGPLIVMLRLIASNKSIQTKLSGVVHLCDSILIKTKDSWNETVSPIIMTETLDELVNPTSSLGEMKSLALECVISLSVEENDKISSACENLLRTCRTNLGHAEWSEMVKGTICPRVVTLIESLPNLAKSGRESELSNVMKLVSGYLANVTMVEKKNLRSDQQFLLKTLSHQLTRRSTRQCLVDIFTMDTTEEAPSKLLHYHGGRTKGFYNIRYRYLRGPTVGIARNMVHKIALLLGYKRSILFSDECISILFESLSDRVSRNRSLHDSEHSRWLEKHFGLVLLSKEILNAYDTKKHRKKVKMLNALTASIIPIICSDLLWYLPSSTKWDLVQSSESSNILLDGPSSTQLLSSPLSKEKASKQAHYFGSCTEALHGNASLIVGLMDLISSLAITLSSDFNKFVPAILYPLVQKTSDLNSQSVQDSAFICLSHISNAIGYSSLDIMLRAKYSYLMETLISELNTHQVTKTNIHSQAICFYSLHNVIEFMLKHDEYKDDQFEIETKILLLTDVQSSMTRWFNRQFKRNTRELLQNITVPMGLISVFISAAIHLRDILSSLESSISNKMGIDSVYFRWEDLLLEFEEGTNRTAEANELNSSEGEEEPDGPKKTLSAHVLGRLASDLEQILTINSAFLSIADLKLQRKSCELFTAAFGLLATIQNHTKSGDQNDAEITKIGNPLLQSVYCYWPSLQIRFQATTKSFVDSSRTRNSWVSRKHLGVLLSSILDVVSALSGLCDDFIADKFITGIWPHLQHLFAHLLSQQQANELQRYERKTSISSLPFSNTEADLLISMLTCLNRIYSSKCGRALSRTTSIVGTMVLPLLSSDQNEIGESAMEVLRALLRIDGDSLWRELMLESGNIFPANTLRPIAERNKTRRQVGTDTLISKRSRILLRFSDELPEQFLMS